MLLKFRQRIFSWFDSYDITDGMGATVFRVKGHFALFRHYLTVHNADGKEVGVLKEALFRFRPTYEITVNGETLGKIVKEITLFRPRFFFTFNDWRVTGNVMGWDYKIMSGETQIARVSKELFHLSDTYTIDIAKDEDGLLVLMCVLGIDIAKERAHQASSSSHS